MSERKGVNGLRMVPSDGHVRAVGTERYAEGSPARHICYYRRWGRLAGGVSECGAAATTAAGGGGGTGTGDVIGCPGGSTTSNNNGNGNQTNANHGNGGNANGAGGTTMANGSSTGNNPTSQSNGNPNGGTTSSAGNPGVQPAVDQPAQGGQILDWEYVDRFSFEDSDHFEEDSLCSWSSETESLCNNWRGWRRPTAGFGTAKRPTDGE
ncbi:hypothetical protein HZH66_011991 [Vespula vulgaris]|uniref:Uncharacterized protein n=1 Tax=Vespula vulgaris TaxID=7454 RepID=A0A834MUH1_VESVU|nr:hypothetical protein HZH66_011991 [Vespula vulgaris]